MALKFSGTAQYLSKAVSVPSGTPISFSCWFKPTSITTFQALIALSHSVSPNNQFTMYVDTAGKLNGAADLNGAGGGAISTAALTNNAWHHCVVVYTSATSRVVYLDGVAGTVNTSSVTPGPMDTLSIGMNLGGTSTPTNLNSGTMAYSAVHGIALSPSDVATLFANGDPFLVEQASELHFTRLESTTPVDLFSSVPWVATGTPTFAADPFTTAASAPAVITTAPTLEGQTTITLGGNVPNDNGALVTVEGFNYGLTSGYGSTVSQVVSTAGGPFALPVTGLTHGTTYHFQAFATNSLGTTVSPDQTFVAGAAEFVQKNSGFAVTSGIYGLQTFLGAQIAGDANFVCFSLNNTVPLNVTDTSGNIYNQVAFINGPSNWNGYIYAAFGIKAALAGANTVKVTAGTTLTTIDLNILEYANCGKIDTFASQNGTSTTPTSPTITPAAINELLLGYFFESNFTGSVTAGSGYTFRVTSNPPGDGVEDALSTSTSPVSATFNSSTSVSWSCFIVAIAGNAAMAPTCTPVGGHYDLPTVVRMTSATPGASIYYTIDGSTPTTGSTLYTGPVVLPASGAITLSMTASATGVLNSTVSVYQFYIQAGGLWGTVDDQFDVTSGQRVHQMSGTIFYDPVSGYWYKYSTSELNAGGFYIYKSADLLNWQFVSLNPYSGFRTYCFYNALNNNYVIWGGGATAGNGKGSWVSTSPEGPFVAANSYDTWQSINIDGGDFGGYFDPNTGNAYLITVCNSNADLMIVQLSADFKSLTNTYALITSETGEAPTMWSNGPNSYFLMRSPQTNWAPGVNSYQWASSPLGPWTAYPNGTNAFQAATIPQTPGEIAGGITATAANAYDTQTSQVLIITGRKGVLYCGDRYDFSGLPFYNYRRIMLPIVQGSTTFTISWAASWNLNASFPAISGLPAAATGLIVTAGVATWTNNEPLAANVYLDGASDAGFSAGVSSQAIAAGVSTVTILVPSAYYRVRTVNANGTSLSDTFTLVTQPISFARLLLEINNELAGGNHFCPGCGAKSISTHGGACFVLAAFQANAHALSVIYPGVTLS